MVIEMSAFSRVHISMLIFLYQHFNSQSLYIIFQCAIALLAAPDIETCKYSMAFHRTRSLSPLLSPSVREGKSRRMEKGQISPPPPLSLTHKLSDKLVGFSKMWPVVRGRVIKASFFLLQVWTINITKFLVGYCVYFIANPWLIIFS